MTKSIKLHQGKFRLDINQSVIRLLTGLAGELMESLPLEVFNERLDTAHSDVDEMLFGLSEVFSNLIL